MAEGSSLSATEPVRVLFAMEQHLGHRTYAENLRAHIDTTRFEAVWAPVTYELDGPLARVPWPDSVRSALACRRQVRRGVHEADAGAHVFNTQVPAVLGGAAARSRPFVVVTDVTPRQYDRIAEGYGHTPDRPGPTAWLKDRLNRRTFTAASWCVGWSQWVCDSFVDDYAVPRERTRVIPPGVDTTLWRPGPERDDTAYRILFVGGDFQRKGGEHLLKAFAALPGNAELVLVTKSDVPRVDRVRVVADLGPNDPRLIELFRASDVFVLPSLAEAFGIAAVEASAAGLPVIAADVGGLPDIVADGESGFVVPPGDTAAMEWALHALAEPAARRRMGSAARQRAEERFDARTNATRLLDLVEQAARQV